MEWIVIIGLIIYLIFERDRTNRLERELKELKQRIAPLHRPDPGAHVQGLPQDERRRAAGDSSMLPHPVSVSREKELKEKPSPFGPAKNRNRRFLVPFRPEEKRPPSLPPAAPVPNGNS